MKITLTLSLIALLFTQTSNSQIINYQQIALIVIGEDYSEEDTQIIKENIKTNKDEKLASRLLELDNKLYKKFVAQGTRTIPCEELQNSIAKNKQPLKSLRKEIEKLKSQFKKKADEKDLVSINKKIVNYNSLNEKQNNTIKNYKDCRKQRKLNKEEYNKISGAFFKAYSLKKDSISSIENDED